MAAVKISPLSVVDSRADIAHDVEIGPFCVVGPDVRIGAGCKLDSHVVLVGHTTIGCHNRFHANSVIGDEPQDYSYGGSPTRVEIGDNNVFREGVTVHRGAEKEDGVTRIGHRNMFMANSHVAHNCQIGDGVVLINGVLLGGHVRVHDRVIVSGNAVVHHFATLGTMCFVSGSSKVHADVPPYMLYEGCDIREVRTINFVGLQRNGILDSTVTLLKQAHRLLYRDCKAVTEVRDIFHNQLGAALPFELTNLMNFLEERKDGRKGRAGEARRGQPFSQDTGDAAATAEGSPERRRAA
jgi:UDP-N-acetylglucosamine acyltransferase